MKQRAEKQPLSIFFISRPAFSLMSTPSTSVSCSILKMSHRNYPSRLNVPQFAFLALVILQWVIFFVVASFCVSLTCQPPAPGDSRHTRYLVDVSAADNRPRLALAEVEAGRAFPAGRFSRRVRAAVRTGIRDREQVGLRVCGMISTFSMPSTRMPVWTTGRNLYINHAFTQLVRFQEIGRGTLDILCIRIYGIHFSRNLQYFERQILLSFCPDLTPRIL